MVKGFRLLKHNPYEDTDNTIKNYYSSWREFNKGNSETKETFTMLFSSFKEKHLPTIEGGALKLYLFFCFSANNNNGESWYSIEKLAESLEVGTRTINKWIKILVERELIYRDQNNHRSLTTYLLPYSTTLMKVKTKIVYSRDSQEILNDVVNSLRTQQAIFGELISVYHIFQWSTSKKRRKRTDQNIQWLLFITRRTNGILTGHYYELKNSEHKVVSKKNIDDPYFFHSTFSYEEKPLLGIALNNETDITSNPFEPLKELIEELATIDINMIDENHFLDYEDIDEIDTEIQDEI
ncbi:helix-turn-helix domain-containing protein [Priestia koreensis]|uniref:helix-turn-helix domain-containing protein n=1 Tax=Priestia koreensis TaxID=284581 RepID=UPI0030185107